MTSFLFEDKFQFSARQSLPYERRRCFSLLKFRSSEVPDIRGDVWSVKAPDFSVKLFKSLREPHDKKSSVSPRPPAEKKRVKFPNISPEKEKRKTKTAEFRSFHRPPGGLEEELQFVKTGKYPAERYTNPKPHDFRPLDEDVPDFITRFDKDPGDLKIRLKARDTIENPWHTSVVRESRSQMDTFRPAEPRWDPRLLLPLGPWPPKSASYMRHRRRRGAYSAFLERVEEKLTRSWKKAPEQSHERC